MLNQQTKPTKTLDLERNTDKISQFFALLMEIDRKSKRKGKENGNKSI
jgi:hypothetical protein